MVFLRQLADGPDEVRKAAREQMRQGADHVKIMMSGGVASPYDPLDSLQFTPGEAAAAVEEAAAFGRYVCAHAYTPEAITQAAVQAMAAGKTRYTSPHGLPELRKAVAEWFEREFGLRFEARQVTVTVGVKQGLFNLMLAVVGEGDEVMIPSPYWVSYPEMARIAGFIAQALRHRTDEAALARIKGEVTELCRAFPAYPNGV